MIKNLKKLRTEKGISQQKLAEYIGVSQQSINKYENHDIEPDITTLTLFANFFGTSIDYLVGNTDINHKIEKVEPFELNEIELQFINKFRKLSDDEKESILNVIDIYVNKKRH